MDVINRVRVRCLIAAASVFTASASLPAVADVYTNSDGQRVECHYEQKTTDGHPVAAPLAGAVVGGVVGHQFGKGNGKDVATVAGAGAGAYAGKSYNDDKVASENANAGSQKVCQPVSG